MQNSHKSVLIFTLAAFMSMCLVGSGFAVWNFNENAQDEALNGHNVGVYVTSSSYQGDFNTDGPTMLVLDVGVSNTSLTTGINFFKQVTSENDGKTEYHITNDLTIEFIPLFEDYATYNGAGNPTTYNGYDVLQLTVDNAGERITDPDTGRAVTVPATVNYVDVLSMNLALSGPIAQILKLSDLYDNLVDPAIRRVSFGKLEKDITFVTEFTAHCCLSVRANPETGKQKLVYSYKLVIRNAVLCLSYISQETKLTLDNYQETIDLLDDDDSALAFNFFVQELNQD